MINHRFTEESVPVDAIEKGAFWRLIVYCVLCIVYAMLFVNTVNMKIKACNALNAIFFDTIDTGVCGFYTTLYAE